MNNKKTDIFGLLMAVLIIINIFILLMCVFYHRNKTYHYPDIHSYVSIKRPVLSPYDYVCISRDKDFKLKSDDYIKIRKGVSSLSYFALIVDPKQDSIINFVDNSGDVAGYKANNYTITLNRLR